MNLLPRAKINLWPRCTGTCSFPVVVNRRGLTILSKYHCRCAVG